MNMNMNKNKNKNKNKNTNTNKNTNKNKENMNDNMNEDLVSDMEEQLEAPKDTDCDGWGYSHLMLFVLFCIFVGSMIACMLSSNNKVTSDLMF